MNLWALHNGSDDQHDSIKGDLLTPCVSEAAVVEVNKITSVTSFVPDRPETRVFKLISDTIWLAHCLSRFSEKKHQDKRVVVSSPSRCCTIGKHLSVLWLWNYLFKMTKLSSIAVKLRRKFSASECSTVKEEKKYSSWLSNNCITLSGTWMFSLSLLHSKLGLSGGHRHHSQCTHMFASLYHHPATLLPDVVSWDPHLRVKRPTERGVTGGPKRGKGLTVTSLERCCCYGDQRDLSTMFVQGISARLQILFWIIPVNDASSSSTYFALFNWSWLMP